MYIARFSDKEKRGTQQGGQMLDGKPARLIYLEIVTDCLCQPAPIESLVTDFMSGNLSSWQRPAQKVSAHVYSL
jgi:hypothetical protein